MKVFGPGLLVLGALSMAPRAAAQDAPAAPAPQHVIVPPKLTTFVQAEFPPSEVAKMCIRDRGNNAPFIGLFGTVIGVIVAFADLAEGSSKIQMDKVMGGIAEALIATGVGLFVAIPAVVAYNVYQKKITDIEDNVSSMNKRLCALLAVVGTFGETPPPPPVDARAVVAEDLAEAADAPSSPQLRANVQDAEE